MTPVVIYHILNSGHHATIISEICLILIEAQDKADEEDCGYKDNGHFSVPKIHEQDTTVLSVWPSFMQHHRKFLHLECSVEKLTLYRILSNDPKKLICSHQGGEIL